MNPTLKTALTLGAALLLAACNGSDKTDDTGTFGDGGAAGDGGASGDGGSAGDGGSEGDGGAGDGGSAGDFDSTVIVDGAWRIVLAEATWVEPAGVGSLLGSMIDYDLLLGVTGVDGDNLDTLLALGQSGVDQQDYCQPTLALTGDFSAAPTFAIGPDDLSIPYNDADLVLNDFQMAGTFSADGELITDGAISGYLDMRELAPALESSIGTSDPDEVCSLLAGFGVTCGACASDGASYCVDLALEDIEAERQDFSLREVAEAGTDPDCEG